MHAVNLHVLNVQLVEFAYIQTEESISTHTHTVLTNFRANRMKLKGVHLHKP